MSQFNINPLTKQSTEATQNAKIRFDRVLKTFFNNNKITTSLSFKPKKDMKIFGKLRTEKVMENCILFI
jgi:hypothetical protein